MGCIYSTGGLSEDDSDKEKKKSRRGTYVLTTEDGKFKTSAQKKDFDAATWIDDTKSIWERPISSLSCHMDLPRLGAKIRIYNSSNELISEEVNENQVHKMEVVKNILLQLTETSQDPQDLIDAINNRYYEFINEDGTGDLSQQLKTFLEEVVPNDSRLSNILSLCHQKIVFPAYYSIKRVIHDALPFKDSRGSWQIDIYISEDLCKVVHSKIQMAKDSLDGEEPEFSFRWELNVVLQGSTFENVKEINVKIPEVTVRANVDAGRAQQIRNIFDSYQ